LDHCASCASTTSKKGTVDLSKMNFHQPDMRVILDCLGEDFDKLFLDEDAELSVKAGIPEVWRCPCSTEI